jgi:hypothetical protein
MQELAFWVGSVSFLAVSGSWAYLAFVYIPRMRADAHETAAAYRERLREAESKPAAVPPDRVRRNGGPWLPTRRCEGCGLIVMDRPGDHCPACGRPGLGKNAESAGIR